ncbi:hypothetical protein [Egbenema bharatensis]|uniref:hypothetical protein n=1 Tax=Egbenema bharatensis TaxID=3463334 RepID=UPI003A8AF01C
MGIRRKIGLFFCFVCALLLGMVMHQHGGITRSLTANSQAVVHPVSVDTDQDLIEQVSLAPAMAQSSPVADSGAGSGITPGDVAAAGPYAAIDEYHNYRFSVNGDQVFRVGNLPGTSLRFNETDLLTVLQNTQAYFQTYAQENPDVQREGILGTQGVTVSDVLNTLEFMISTLQEDIANQQPIRLKDPNFINTHFRVMEWTAYNPDDPGQRLVRLTKYAVFTHPGSRTPTATYNIPLYRLGTDAETDRFYLNYTKQDVLAGIYEPGGREHGRVEPLAYLTRDSFEDALMQGTILINFTDGTSAFFNVDRNNGIAYDRSISPYRQGRYWYFRPVNSIQGYGHEFDAKIAIKPGVTFAGDVLNVGLGRIIVLEHSTGGQAQLQLGIMADTGGAFMPNLHQLDFLAGVFRDRNEFYAQTSSLPEYARAYILVKKD